MALLTEFCDAGDVSDKGKDSAGLFSHYHGDFDFELFTEHPHHNGRDSIVWRAWEAHLPLEQRVGQTPGDLDTAFSSCAELRLYGDTWCVDMLNSWGHGAGSALMDHLRETYGNELEYTLGDDQLWPGARPFLERYRNRTGWWPSNVAETLMQPAALRELDQYLRNHHRLMRSQGYVDLDGAEANCGVVAGRIAARLLAVGESPTVAEVVSTDGWALEPQRVKLDDEWLLHMVCINRGEVLDPIVGGRMSLERYMESAFKAPAQVSYDSDPGPKVELRPLTQLLPNTPTLGPAPGIGL